MAATITIQIESLYNGTAIDAAIRQLTNLATQAANVGKELGTSSTRAATAATEMANLARETQEANAQARNLDRTLGGLDGTLATLNANLATLAASMAAYTAAITAGGAASTSSRTAMSAMATALELVGRTATTATSAARSYAETIQRLGQLVGSAARWLGSSLSSGLARTGQMFGTATRSASSFFAGLRRALDGGGGLLLGFGQKLDSTQSKIERFAGAYSLLIAGGLLKGAGAGLMNIGGFGNYLDFDQLLTKASIATLPIEDLTSQQGYVPGQFSNRQILIDLVQSIQRGNIRGLGGGTMPAVTSMSANDIMSGIYYLASAVGTPITGQGAPGGFYDYEVLAQRLMPMLQVSAYAKANPEQTIKGILNLGAEFGLDVRDMGPATTSSLQDITAKVAFLSQQTSLEVNDIMQAFKMVGPMVHTLTGKEGLAGLNDTFSLMAIEAEAGLRGSIPGRALAQAFTTLLDMPLNAQNVVKSVFGGSPEEVFFNKDMTLKGGPQGIISMLAGLPEDKWIQITSQVFTSNATRALVAAVSQVRQNPKLLEEWNKLFSGEGPSRGLSEAIAQLNNSLAANFQKVKAAWFGVQTELIRSVEGPLKSAFKGFASVLWNISDIIQKNPWIAQWIVGLTELAGVVLYAVGSLLTFSGAILILQRGLFFVGGRLMVILDIVPALLKLLAVGVPLLAAFAAGFFLLQAAWDANILGVKDVVNAFRTDFAGSFDRYVNPALEKVRVLILLTGLAIRDFVKIVALGQAPLGALGRLLDRVFGDLLGPRIYANVLRLGQALDHARDSVAKFFSGIDNTRASFGDALRTAQMFVEQLLLGVSQTANRQSALQIGAWLGIDDLPGKIDTAANAIRGSLEAIVTYVRNVAVAVSGPLTHAWTNFTSALTGANFQRAVAFLRGVLQGVAAGLALTLYGAAKAVEAFASALTKAGSAGRWIADQIRQWTGLQVTIQGVGQAIGLALGSLLGARLLLAIPILNKVALSLLQIGVNAVGVGVQFTLLVTRLAVTAATWVAYGAAQLMAQSISLVIMGVNGLLAGSFTILGTTVTGFTATLVAMTAVFVGAIGIFTTLAAGILVVVGVTQGWNAAWQAATAFFNGFMATVGAAVGVIAALVGIISTVVGAFANLIGATVSVNTAMYALGAAVGVALTGLAVNAAAALGRPIWLLYRCLRCRDSLQRDADDHHRLCHGRSRGHGRPGRRRPRCLHGRHACRYRRSGRCRPTDHRRRPRPRRPRRHRRRVRRTWQPPRRLQPQHGCDGQRDRSGHRQGQGAGR
jgi:hypothetical protein